MRPCSSQITKAQHLSLCFCPSHIVNILILQISLVVSFSSTILVSSYFQSQHPGRTNTHHFVQLAFIYQKLPGMLSFCSVLLQFYFSCHLFFYLHVLFTLFEIQVFQLVHILKNISLVFKFDVYFSHWVALLSIQSILFYLCLCTVRTC